MTLKNTLLGLWRFVCLIGLLIACVAHGAVTRPRDLRARSRWRMRWSRRVARAIGLRIDTEGMPPSSGVLVSNHLSYLDVLAYGAVFDGAFVAKREVRSWPLIGFITHVAGTIYVERERARSAAEANRAVGRALDQRLPVLLFPEGTSSSGAAVLPFQPPLFQAAAQRRMPVWPSAVRYRLQNGREQDEQRIAYWGSMTFLPHMLRTLCLGSLAARIVFAPEPVEPLSRREACDVAHAAVVRLRSHAG